IALKKGLRETIPENTPDEFGDLIVQCWSEEPRKRPSASDIIQQLKKLRSTKDYFNDNMQTRDVTEKDKREYSFQEINEVDKEPMKINMSMKENIIHDDSNKIDQPLDGDKLYRLGLTHWNGKDNMKENFIKAVEYFQQAADQ